MQSKKFIVLCFFFFYLSFFYPQEIFVSNANSISKKSLTIKKVNSWIFVDSMSDHSVHGILYEGIEGEKPCLLFSIPIKMFPLSVQENHWYEVQIKAAEPPAEIEKHKNLRKKLGVKDSLDNFSL